MGCTSPQEKIEDNIMQLKMLRTEIQMERENKINQLSEIEKRKITHPKIPDYIDPEFALEKQVYYINRTDLEYKLPKENNGIEINKKPKKIKKAKSKKKNKK